MAHPAGGHLVFQRRDDGLLAHHVFKAGRPPLAVERAIHSLHLPNTKKAGSARGPTPFCPAKLGIRMQAG